MNKLTTLGVIMVTFTSPLVTASVHLLPFPHLQHIARRDDKCSCNVVTSLLSYFVMLRSTPPPKKNTTTNKQAMDGKVFSSWVGVPHHTLFVHRL